MCEHSVQLFAKFRKRNENSQRYSTNNRKTRLKALYNSQICKSQLLTLLMKSFKNMNRTGERKSGR